jgi:hypothetical protein
MLAPLRHLEDHVGPLEDHAGPFEDYVRPFEDYVGGSWGSRRAS